MKWTYQCLACDNLQHYKVSMDTRYKCKKCGNRSAEKMEYSDPTHQPAQYPRIQVFYANNYCPECKKFIDFKVQDSVISCPECNYTKPGTNKKFNIIDLN